MNELVANGRERVAVLIQNNGAMSQMCSSCSGIFLFLGWCCCCCCCCRDANTFCYFFRSLMFLPLEEMYEQLERRAVELFIVQPVVVLIQRVSISLAIVSGCARDHCWCVMFNDCIFPLTHSLIQSHTHSNNQERERERKTLHSSSLFTLSHCWRALLISRSDF